MRSPVLRLEDSLYYQSNMFRGNIDHAMHVSVPQQNYVEPTYQEQSMPYLVFTGPGYSQPEQQETVFVRTTPEFIPGPEPAMEEPEPMEEPEMAYDPIGMNATFINMAFQEVIPNFSPPEPEPTMVGNGINELVEFM